MKSPTNLGHKPIVSIDHYNDGTDAQALSVGKAQYDNNEISAKVFRYVNHRWSRQSEELPLGRLIELNNTVLKSILVSAGLPVPMTDLDVTVVAPKDLGRILSYYKVNREDLLPRLRNLKILLDYFMSEEPKW